MPLRLLLALACSGAWSLACFVDVPLTGRACGTDHPCLDGYRCVEALCVDESDLRPCSNDFGCQTGEECVEDFCLRVRHDAGAPDAGAHDAGELDAGALDAGRVDAGERDGGDDPGASDGGGSDAGPWDGGVVDGGDDSGPWHLPDWQHRRRVRFINSLDGSERLLDFPVGVRLDPAWLPPGEHSASGDDLRFVDLDGTLLSYEIEALSGGSGIAWVRVPAIEQDRADDSIWLYYGNPAATPGANAAAVWSNGFVAVFHLDDADDDGLVDNSVSELSVGDASETSSVAGAFGPARSLSGAAIDLSAINGAFPTVGTFSVAFRAQSSGFLLDQDDTREQLVLELAGGELFARARDNDGDVVEMSQGVGADVWTLASLSWNDAAVLGFSVSSVVQTSAATDDWLPSQQDVMLGSGLSGDLDEVRVESAVRSVGWTRAHRANLDGRFVVLDAAPIAPPVPPRVGPRVAGAAVLFDFEEPGAQQVDDGALGLDITAPEPGELDWVSGGLVLAESTMLQRTAGNDALKTACASGDITIEAWLMADNDVTDGPARVLSLSGGPVYRNFTLGQSLDRWQLRLRTSTTDTNGSGNGSFRLRTGEGTVRPGDVQHVVFVRDGDSTDVVSYVDGVHQGATPWAGDFSAWENGFSLLVANELGGGRPFLGAVYLLAVYCEALSESQVQQNFSAGP